MHRNLQKSDLPTIAWGVHHLTSGVQYRITSLWFVVNPREHTDPSAGSRSTGPITRVQLAGRPGERGRLRAYDAERGWIDACVMSFDETRAFIDRRWLQPAVSPSPRRRPQIEIIYQ